MYGVRLGYIAALNPQNAFRVYADFNSGVFSVDNDDFHRMTAGGGLDFLYNFGNVFGLFLELDIIMLLENLLNLVKISGLVQHILILGFHGRFKKEFA